MTGDKHIINLRLRKQVPAWVFINDYPCQTPTDDKYPNVCVAGDEIERLDLRFLVGMQVSISSGNESRCKALLNACKRHGARVVAAAVITDNPFDNGFAEIYGIPN